MIIIEDVVNWGRFLSVLRAIGKEVKLVFKDKGCFVIMREIGNSLIVNAWIKKDFFTAYAKGDILFDLNMLDNLTKGERKEGKIKIDIQKDTFDYFMDMGIEKRFTINMLETVDTIPDETVEKRLENLNFINECEINLNDFMDFLKSGRKLTKHFTLKGNEKGVFLDFISEGVGSMNGRLKDGEFNVCASKFNSDLFYDVLTPLIVPEGNQIKIAFGSDYPLRMIIRYSYIRFKIYVAPMVITDGYY